MLAVFAAANLAMIQAAGLRSATNVEDDGIVAEQDRDEGEHDIKIKIQLPSIAITLAAASSIPVMSKVMAM